MIQSIDSRAAMPVLSNVSSVAFSGDQILYVRDGALSRRRSIRRRGACRENRRRSRRTFRIFMRAARRTLDASPTGVIVFQTDTAAGDLVELDRNGSEIRHLGDGERSSRFRLMPWDTEQQCRS